MGRGATGVGLATLTLTAAVLTQNYPPAVVAFVAITLAILVATAAPHVRYLHRIPKVGAPRLSAVFDLEGLKELQVRIGPAPVSAVLVVGVYSEPRRDVEGMLSVIASPSLGASPCDPTGLPDDRWIPNPPTGELAEDGRRAPFWTQERRLRGGVWTHFRFKLEPERTGCFWVRVKVTSSQLYEQFEKDEEVAVVAGDGRSSWEQISAAIRSGEALGKRLESMAAGTLAFDAGTEFATWTATADAAVPAELQAAVDLPQTEPSGSEHAAEYALSRSGVEYLLSRLKDRISGLYEARRRL